MDKNSKENSEAKIDPFKKEPKKVEKHPLHKKVNLWMVFGVVFIVGIFIWVVGASVTGGAVVDSEATTATIVSSIEQKLDELGVNLNVSSEIEACSKRNTNLHETIEDRSNELIKCQILTGEQEVEISLLQKEKEVSVSRDELESVREVVTEKEDEIIDLKKELEDVEDKYLPVIKEAARKICCIEKLDDSSINSYNIGESKIHCVNDGQNSISC